MPQPMQATAPQPIPMQAVQIQAVEPFTAGVGYTPAAPAGKWKSDLCDWDRGSRGMCWAACCCSFLTVPQLYEKGLGKKGNDDRSPKFTGTCNYCKKPGHMERDCRAKKRMWTGTKRSARLTPLGAAP